MATAHPQALDGGGAPPLAGPQLRTFALIGNPNAGKTTLFNALTGLRQKVGNYPGVTVERSEGITFNQHGERVGLIDLPGLYSLSPQSPDEQITVDCLLGRIPGIAMPDGLICVVDASNLERHLFLATQLAELGRPMIVALTLLDVARRRGLDIDLHKLSERLGVPVIDAQQGSRDGLMRLKLALTQAKAPDVGSAQALHPKLLAEAVEDVAPRLRSMRPDSPVGERAEALLRLQEDPEAAPLDPLHTQLQLWRTRLDREAPGWRSRLITDRYGRLGTLMRDTVQRLDARRRHRSEQLDAFLLHPVSGLLVLGAVLFALFFSVFKLAVPLMDGVDAGFGWLGMRAQEALPPGPVADLVIDGILAGVGGVVIFLPQILLLFFCIALLESSGYMARAAFLLDRLMSGVGLHGRSFIPLLSSYACAIPGIMATRSIPSARDRLATILVAPFMTCSARLPVFLVMIAALLPAGEHSALSRAALMFGLYALGTVTALLCAFAFKRLLGRGREPTQLSELPAYQWPRLKQVLQELWGRSLVFLQRAGTIILGLSILLWFALHYPKVPEAAAATTAPAEVLAEDGLILDGPRVDPLTGAAVDPEDAAVPSQLEASFAGQLGQALEPVFAPLGYDWKITVGILTSFAAREVFISTLSIIYLAEEDAGESLLGALREQERADGSALFSPLTCLSIMVFFVFALQCFSTVAVVKRETNSWGWALSQLAFMSVFAWVAAAAVYQGGQLLGFQ